MAPTRWLPWTMAAAVAAVVLARALAVFTFPSDGQGTRAIRWTIAAALGDAGPALPAASSFVALPAAAELRPSSEARPGADGPRFRSTAAAPSVGREARGWARAAAAANPAALRRWLTVPVFTSRRTRADTTWVVSRRVSLGEGCPPISTLRAAFHRDPDGLHLISLASDCPRLRGADAAHPRP